MKSKTSLFLVILIIIIGGVFYWSEQDQKTKAEEAANAPVEEQINREAEIVLFYGEECPHCKDVEEFLTQNNISEKVNYSNLEVWHNKNNAQFLFEKAEACGYSKDNLGVPFLYARGECFSGAPAIEGFFKKEAGI